MKRLPLRVLAVMLMTLAGTSPAAGQSSPALPDFDAARREAVEILQDLIRIDTSNPPGNETEAAEFLRAILDREGIPSQIFELEPGRGNLVARLTGNGSKRPVIVMGHTDVVGVERDQWTTDPFAAEIRDGYVYGRGAIDDKDTVAAGLVAMLLIHRQNLPLDRDIIYIAEAGEEGTPSVGIEFLIERHWDGIAAEYALAEGGMMAMRSGNVAYVGVATTEKVPRGMTLRARGTSGHGSMPRVDNPIVRLSTAVAKLGAWQPPKRLNETTRTFFERMAGISEPREAFLFSHIEDPIAGPLVEEHFRHHQVRFNSMLRTSVSPNIISGGFRSNVIPGEAEATLDVRAVPDEDIEALADEIERLIDDPAVEVVRPRGGRPASPPSRLGSELFLAIERTQQTMYPGAVTVPMMLTGATDMAQLRAKGVQAYGLGPEVDEAESRAHGNDERVGVEAMGRFVEFIYRTLVDIAVSGNGTTASP